MADTSEITAAISNMDLIDNPVEGIAKYIENMPSEAWWQDVHDSFKRLEELIKVSWLVDATTDEDLEENTTDEELDEDTNGEDPTHKVRLIRQGALPFIAVLPSGTHALRVTATNERLECVAFGTMGTNLFIDLFWESITKAQEEDNTIVVHEVLSFLPRIRVSVGKHEFELKYVQAEVLIRRYPDPTRAKPEFLEDSRNCSQNVREIVNNLHTRPFGHEHRKAYHYIRTWAIYGGIFNQKPGISTQQIVAQITPREGEGKDADSLSLITQFFQTFENDTYQAGKLNGSEDDWEKILWQAANLPFHRKVKKFPYIIRIALIYSGSSKAQGGAWLSLVDRKVPKLKERLEKQIDLHKIQIWPQRLVSSDANRNDSIYEGYIVIGLRCPASEIPKAEEVCDRWKEQVDEDSVLFKSFINVTIAKGISIIEQDNLEPDTRVWPKPVVHQEDDRSKQESDTEEKVKVKKGTPKKPSTTANASGEKGAVLRPARDVLGRLRYDSRFNIDDCIVGYEDRHSSKIKEKPAANWISETTDKEWIPEHRIMWFKQNGITIWDKSSRVDQVFGSG